MKKHIVLLMSFVVLACATPYQRIGDTGGYYHLRLKKIKPHTTIGLSRHGISVACFCSRLLLRAAHPYR